MRKQPQARSIHWDESRSNLVVLFHGRTDEVLIPAKASILLEGGSVVNGNQIKIGDKILAYGFDILPPRRYNAV